MNHILIGAGIPFVLCLLPYMTRRGRASLTWLLATPAAMALGAAWALVPDVPRVLGLHDLYLQRMHDPRTNIFFWHHRLDATESDSPLAIAGCVLLVVALFAIAWRELRLREGGL